MYTALVYFKKKNHFDYLSLTVEMNDKHLKMNFLFTLKNYMNFTKKGLSYIHSPLLVGEI